LGCFKIHKETPCAKPSDPSSTEEKPAASPAKEVPVKRPEEANDVVEKTQQKASAASPAKEIPVARPIIVEEEKYILEKTQFEAIGNVLPTTLYIDEQVIG
jgi:hypothetical protein